MKLRKTCILLFGVFLTINQFGQNEFRLIENKGQWPENVTHRTALPGGFLFTEKNQFTFNFYDQKKIDKIYHSHTAHESEIKKDPIVNFHSFTSTFKNSNKDVRVISENPYPTKYAFLLGKDKSKWGSNALAYQNITYQNLYEGIDLSIKANESQFKYDFIVSAKANPKNIIIKYEGDVKLKIENGNLKVKTSVNDYYEEKPYAYQDINGNRIKVDCSFKLNGNNEVSFELGKYNKSFPLVIDPSLIFSTYSGSTSDNFGYTACFDQFGFLYSGSTVFGAIGAYPTTAGAYQTSFAGGTGNGNAGTDIAISKYDTTGGFMVYSTLLGGNSDELPHSIITNSNDEIFILGTTGSANFPMTNNAYDTIFSGGTNFAPSGLGIRFPNGSDIFIARLSANGQNLMASTFVGGTSNDGLNIGTATKFNYADEVRGEIMVDDNNNCFIVSSTLSNDFPTTTNAFQKTIGGALDAVVFKMDNNLTTLVWSTYLGGTLNDAGYAMELDKKGDIYITGGTASTDFDTTANTLQTTFQGGRADGFISHLSANGSNLLHSTYWGTTDYDQSYFVELDRSNNVHVFGQTQHSGSFFINNALYNKVGGGQFVSKLTPELDSVIWSTAFGSGNGAINISPTAFLVDVCSKMYLSGWGGAVNSTGNTVGMDVIATAPDTVYDKTTDGSDFYLMVLEDDASKLFYATYFGSPTGLEHVDGGTSRFDRNGRVYQSVCASCGGDQNFPTTPGAHSSSNNATAGGRCNNGVFKFDFNLPIVVADFVTPPIGCTPYTHTFTNLSKGLQTTIYNWNFGDGNTSTLKNPTHTYTNPGTYTITLTVSDTGACNFGDTVIKSITILGDTSYSLANQSVCFGENIQIGLSPNPDPSITYAWLNGSTLNDTTVSNPIATPNVTTTYILLISNGVCTDTVYQTVNVINMLLNLPNDTFLCGSDSILLIANTFGTANNYVWSKLSNFAIPLNNPNDSTIKVFVNSSGYYYFKGTNGMNCEIKDSVLITISDPDISISNNISICSGDTGFIMVTNNTPIISLNYFWQPNSGIISYNNDSSVVYVSPSSSTMYYVTATDQNGCQVIDSAFVYVSGINFGSLYATTDKDTVVKGENTVLHAYPQPGFTYTWSPTSGLNNPNIANPTATPEVTTTYTVTISDPNAPGCFRTTQVTVYVIELVCGEPDIFIPNAFTPDGNGENDLLFVRGNNIDEMLLRVYDRWGELVFETTDQNTGWDGTFKGKDVDPAVFVYYLEITCLGGEKYFKKGNVTVIR